MTWYADEIILHATPAAVQAVRSSTQLAPFAYHVRSLDGHEWYRQEQEHGLPEGGLLVVRPVCGRSSHGFDWHDADVLDWDELPRDREGDVFLDPTVTQLLGEYLNDESLPPPQLRTTVAALAARLGQPALYYGCGMWGGDIDYEYSLVYSPTESLHLTRSALQPSELGGVDALRVGLEGIGLVLPSGYFALHSRGFPWQEHRLSGPT